MSTHNMPLLDKYPGIVYRCDQGHLEELTNNFNKMNALDDEPTDNIPDSQDKGYNK